MKEEKESLSLIDKLLKAKDEVIKAANRPRIKKRIKRAIESAKDDLEEQKDEALSKIEELRGEVVENPERAPGILTKITENKQVIINAENTIKFLEEEQET